MGDFPKKHLTLRNEPTPATGLEQNNKAESVDSPHELSFLESEARKLNRIPNSPSGSQAHQGSKAFGLCLCPSCFITSPVNLNVMTLARL